MKVNRDMVARAGLSLLNDAGLEQLTLRQLGKELDVQAATIYWHFKSKQELLDEMATLLLAEAAPHLVPARASAAWTAWAQHFGNGLRSALLACRDGARMVSGTRLTNTVYMKTSERIAARFVEEGFTVRQAIVLLSTIYNYTVSFVEEEQAVFPRPGERSPQYDIAQRNAHLPADEFPLLRQAGAILFDRFDRRYKEGLDLILRGAKP
ncbi:MAG: TetR/AcrR family transcriptional regulator C-terminal domain-containing protein [Edaphobacter sp.]|uniref:TetR/AcrR family transcriptional regulator C-terminal domain-containing protein n=1 Tax=Edaphobacter sp. TaxID=1934404 RepID=UPI00239B3803|nr:TetR/AcrR family transcriptional regulator C-terminal domain-containing protein [Edaphobacter sp.]MDE1178804.1 TetR/AcrR family transcriptional regulator C-terminal domain-containing protein [Edaphobacter sp.]